jgi:5-methylcytosine-specific restriction endonuclease McrA
MTEKTCKWCWSKLDKRPRFCSPKCGQAYHDQLERFGVADQSILPICPCGNLACPDPWKTKRRKQRGNHRRCLDCRKAQRARADAGRGSYKAKRRREIVKAGERITFDDLMMRDGPLCQICGELMDWQTGRYRERVSLDHIIPISKGGSHTMDNVRLVHMGCNSKKSDRLPADVLCRDQ